MKLLRGLLRGRFLLFGLIMSCQPVPVGAGPTPPLEEWKEQFPLQCFMVEEIETLMKDKAGLVKLLDLRREGSDKSYTIYWNPENMFWIIGYSPIPGIICDVPWASGNSIQFFGTEDKKGERI